MGRVSVKMMFMSGYSKDLLDDKDGQLPEYVTFLEKPVSPFQLISKVRQLIGKPAQKS